MAINMSLVCGGVCDVESCDLLENLCLNRVDTMAGEYSLPNSPCQPLAGGILLEVFLFLYAMLALAIVCDDYLCVALERLCDEFLIREDVAGATFMAFGSAAPEVILNTIGTIKQVKSWPPSKEALEATNLGVGAILGSGMIAMLVIPGACALAIDGGVDLLLKRRPLLRDVVAYTISLGLLCVVFADGIIEPYEGAILVIFYVIYVLTVCFSPTIRQWYRRRVLRKVPKKRKSFVKQRPSQKRGSQELQRPLLATDDAAGGGEEGERNDAETRSNPMHGGKDQNISTAKVLFASIEDGPSPEDRKREEEAGLVPNADAGVVDDADGDNAGITLLGDSGSEGDPEKGARWLQTALKILSMPLNLLFEYTCINCEKDGPYEHWYPLTFVVSFLWVSWFSTIISSVASRWIAFSPSWANGSLFGLLCAVGAEIPDTIQSVTMARRGYGSMAVSNAIGSQVLNICIGLGLPWLCASVSIPSWGHFRVTDHANLQIAAFFQFGAVVANFTVLLGVAAVRGESKAKLSSLKGYVLLACYVVVVVSYVVVKFNATSEVSPC